MSMEPRFEHGFLNALFEAAGIGLGLVDTDLRYVRVNEALASMNGVPVADHEGHRVRDVIPELADVAEELLQKVLDTKEPVIDLELIGPTPASPEAQRHFLVSYYPILDGPDVIGVGAVVLDVTERVLAQLELMEQARHIYENVVQDLTVVQLAIEQGEVETATAKAQHALKEAKHITSKVLLEKWPL